LSFSFPFPQFYFEINTHNLENIVSQSGKVNWDDGEIGKDGRDVRALYAYTRAKLPFSLSYYF